MYKIITRAVSIGNITVSHSDKLVTFITEEAGRVAAFANGAGRLKNRFGGAIEPFRHVKIIVYKRKLSAPYRLEEISTIDRFKHLSADYQSLLFASYIAKLGFLTTREGVRELGVYRLLVSFMGLDNQKQTSRKQGRPDWKLLARIFELKLFSETGYRFNLDSCSNCSAKKTDLFSPRSGGFVCMSCAGKFSDSHYILKGTAAFINAAQKMDIHLLNRLKADPAILNELKTIGVGFINQTNNNDNAKM